MIKTSSIFFLLLIALLIPLPVKAQGAETNDSVPCVPIYGQGCPINITQQSTQNQEVNVSQTQTQTQTPLAQVVPIQVASVGIGVTSPAGQVAGVTVTELPKTGLPALAWSVLALIPAGFGLRKFKLLKQDLEDDPNYICENRKFRTR